jgi:protein-disulfide isomerase
MDSLRLRTILDVVSGIALIAASVVIVWTYLRPSPPPGSALPEIKGRVVSLEEAPLKGSPSAPVGVIIYSDFECPFCGAFARDFLPEVSRKYLDAGRVFLAFKHLPLPLHRNARLAARAADCAVRQNKFWLMHDYLFASAEPLTRERVLEGAVHLDFGDDWRSCVAATGDSDRRVDQDLNEAMSLGVRSTPTFLIGFPEGQSLRVETVARGLVDLTEMLDGLLASVPSSAQGSQ